jgi:hypothetical protein
MELELKNTYIVAKCALLYYLQNTGILNYEPTKSTIVSREQNLKSSFKYPHVSGIYLMNRRTMI